MTWKEQFYDNKLSRELVYSASPSSVALSRRNRNRLGRSTLCWSRGTFEHTDQMPDRHRHSDSWRESTHILRHQFRESAPRRILFGGSLLKRHRHHRYQKVEVRRDGWSG